ncbi:ATP binding [Coemansia spiralis]|uniref:ATP binding n=1 Tax=Coemansia spiralis TaxID=417178 RepID=A0A9W8G6M1_9FUNG|nr:ATP binding [Coemansia spiralis]
MAIKSPTAQRFSAAATTATFSELQDDSDSQKGKTTPVRYTMQQVLQWNEARVCQWVCEQGFSKYETTFRENMITGEALVELDYTLLKELSVRTVGERVRLNLAIRRLRQQCLQMDVESEAPVTSRTKRSATLEYHHHIPNGFASQVTPDSSAINSTLTSVTVNGAMPSELNALKHSSKDPPLLSPQ